jgi:hypothetical protein
MKIILELKKYSKFIIQKNKNFENILIKSVSLYFNLHYPEKCLS